MVVSFHISLTSFRFQSRVIKETQSLMESGKIDRILTTALHEKGLAEREIIDENRELLRFRLVNPSLAENGCF